MKLGLLCTMRNGFGKKGYYNSQEVGLGRQLVKDGHQVIIYKAVPPSKGGRIETDTIEPSLNIMYIPMKGIVRHGYCDVSLIDKDLDGLLCFADNQLFLPHVMRYCEKNQIRFVPYFGTTRSMYTSPRGHLINSLFRVFVAPRYRSMQVLAKTPSIRRELAGMGIRNVVPAPVGINFSMLRQDFRDFDPMLLRQEMGYSPEDVLVFSVARMELDKRPQDMVEILNRIKDAKNFKLLIVGKGPLRGEVDQKIHRYGLSDRVRILESVPYEDMWKLYRMADYFLNLNRDEIFGMAIMESVYYCTPVAAIRAPGPSTTLKGMKGHHLCKDDDEIARVLCEPGPDQADLEDSSRRIVKKFSWEKCASAFERLVER